MKSRILSCLLIVALCFSMLSACGSEAEPSDYTPSSASQTENSDSQDSATVESSEPDPAGTSDDVSSEGETEPSQVEEPTTPPEQQTESPAPTEITTASSFSLSDVPEYSGKAYTSVNRSVPYFTAAGSPPFPTSPLRAPAACAEKPGSLPLVVQAQAWGAGSRLCCLFIY